MGITANQQVQSTTIGFAFCGGAIGLAIDKLNEEQKINNWEFEWVFDLKSINMLYDREHCCQDILRFASTQTLFFSYFIPL